MLLQFDQSEILQVFRQQSNKALLEKIPTVEHRTNTDDVQSSLQTALQRNTSLVDPFATNQSAERVATYLIGFGQQRNNSSGEQTSSLSEHFVDGFIILGLRRCQVFISQFDCLNR